MRRGQTTRYAGIGMNDADAAVAGWASRAPWWPRTLSVRRDLALPLVLLTVQLTGAAITGGTFNLSGPATSSTQSTAPRGRGGLGAARGRAGGPGRAAMASGAGAVGVRSRHGVAHWLHASELRCRVLRGGHR